MKKKILSSIFTLSIFFSVAITPALAAQDMDTVTEPSMTSVIDGKKIEALYQKYDVEIQEITEDSWSEALALIEDRAEIRNEISVINDEAALTRSATKNATYEEIARLEAEIEVIDKNLEEYSVVELTIDDLIDLGLIEEQNELTRAKPKIPNDTNYVSFSSISGSTGGYYYFAIFAESTYPSGTWGNISRPLYLRTLVNLLDNSHTTKQILQKTILATASELMSLVITAPYAVSTLNTIMDRALESTSPITLQTIFTNSQIMLYAYVSNASNGTYTHMATNETCTIATSYFCEANTNGKVQNASGSANSITYRSNYWGNYTDCINRYKNSYFTTMYDTVGKIEATWNGKTYNLNKQYYPQISTIPGT